jgi:hypothetical protein
VWLGLWLLDEPPSPKVQAYVYGAVPLDAVPVKLTASGAFPAVGDAIAVATGGALITTETMAALAWPEASTTVNCTV